MTNQEKTPSPKKNLFNQGSLLGNYLARSRSAFGLTWQPVVWLVALGVGIATAYVIIFFRIMIGTVQWVSFGTSSEALYSWAATLPFWQIWLIPILGGMLVGGLLYVGRRTNALPEARPQGVADVMEARSLFAGRMSLGGGALNALISAVSLGAGASAGREGPAVHLGATLASHIAAKLNYPAITTRTLLACGAAAAVSASFNAPIAGVLFALEVVLAHYALGVFAPIVIASVSATVVTRLHLDEFPAFIVPKLDFGSYAQLPAFVLLGFIAGVVAILFMTSVMKTTDVVQRLYTNFNIPYWIHPMLGGITIGAMGIFLPQILGVGYEATDGALKNIFPFGFLILLIGAKIAATSVTLASRFGGGVFSPALFLGAMTGAAFGMVAASLFPDLAASEGFYAIVGMGSVSAAVLGAPISTTLIAFELVREYEVAVALMVSVSIATILTQAVVGKSFFYWQMEERGTKLREGPHQAILQTTKVQHVMRADLNLSQVSLEAPALRPTDSLSTVFELMDCHQFEALAVIDPQDSKEIVALVRRQDALEAYNKALIASHIEEHR